MRYMTVIACVLLVICTVFSLTGCFAGIEEETTESSGTSEYRTETDEPDTEPATETEEVTETEPQTEQTTAAEITTEETTAAPETEPATEAETEPPYVNVTGLELDRYSVELYVGESEMPVVTMYPVDATDKREVWTSNDKNICSVNGWGVITGLKEGTCTVTVQSYANWQAYKVVSVTVKKKPEQTTAAKTEAPETTVSSGITYINGILIVNKSYPLPADYNPGVIPEAQAALDKMISAAASQGINLYVISGFRSYSTQNDVYNYYAWRDGTEVADTYSARPGHSEHQSGLAFDLNSLYQSFADTAEGQWLAAHCHEYGFIIRYPRGKESVTGYMYEPWHVRYLGTETATAVYNSGLTLEEYLGIDSYYH